MNEKKKSLDDKKQFIFKKIFALIPRRLSGALPSDFFNFSLVIELVLHEVVEFCRYLVLAWAWRVPGSIDIVSEGAAERVPLANILRQILI